MSLTKLSAPSRIVVNTRLVARRREKSCRPRNLEIDLRCFGLLVSTRGSVFEDPSRDRIVAILARAFVDVSLNVQTLRERERKVEENFFSRGRSVSTWNDCSLLALRNSKTRRLDLRLSRKLLRNYRNFIDAIRVSRRTRRLPRKWDRLREMRLLVRSRRRVCETNRWHVSIN